MINTQRLKELIDTIGSEDLSEISTSYFEETEEVIEALSSEPDNREGFLSRLLFLQSNALVLGLRQFSEFCRQGRDLFKNIVPNTSFFQQLKQIYLQSKQAFLMALTQNRAA